MSIKKFYRALGGGNGVSIYDILSNIELIVDYRGLIVGQNTTHGTVDGSGNITAVKSIAPGPIGRDFTVIGSGVTLTADGITLNGSGRLRHATVGTFNFMHYNATLANMKYTIHAVVKLGTSNNPNAAYGILGNNANSSTNKGFALFFDDRSSIPRNNAIVFHISAGSSGNYILNIAEPNLIPNAELVLTVEVDMSQSEDLNKFRFYINGNIQTITSIGNTTSTPVTTPTYGLEIGGLGNSVLPATGIVKMIIIQSTVESNELRSQFIDSLRAVEGIAFNDEVDQKKYYDVYDSINDGSYHLHSFIYQNPINKYIFVQMSTKGTTHYYDPDKRIILRRSTDRGISYNSPVDAIHPAGAYAVQDFGGGYTANGRLHIIYDQHTAIITTGGLHQVQYVYSDDDGATWSTPFQMSLPSDGLTSFRTYGNIVENEGVIIFPYYKYDKEGDTSPSACYVFRSTDGGATWTNHQVYSSIAHLVSEGWIVSLSNTHILGVYRDEETLEWRQFMSTDNGITWTNQGTVTFGESISGTAAPVCLTKFKISGVDVVCCYFPHRSVGTLKACYAKVSDLIANGLTGWNLDSKILINKNDTGRYLAYGNVVHYNGNFNARAVYPRDYYPVGESPTSEVTYFEVPSYQYFYVKNVLGL